MDELRGVSAYHNYLVDGRLQAEVRVESEDGFFFHAHRLEPGSTLPLVSGVFFDPRGEFLLRMEKNLLVDNPHGFSLMEMTGGWALMSQDMESIVSTQVVGFPHGLLSLIRGACYDSSGRRIIFGDDSGLHLAGSEKNRGSGGFGGPRMASGWR
ncbi:MAG: hypothetical protein ACUVS3_10830 [Thermodesulfobacteriota bacterium]